jgi:hypothetical protein
MRRIWAPAVALLLALGASLAAPAAATAAGVPALAGGCSGSAYPPSVHATIMASTTTPHPGEVIEASGRAYCPNEDVRITLKGRFVTTTHTDGTGAFDPPVKVRGTGSMQLCGIGASGLPGDRDCITLTVTAHGTGGVQQHKPSGGGTSLTGVDAALLCLAAGVLVALGWGLLLIGRRRRVGAGS